MSPRVPTDPDAVPRECALALVDEFARAVNAHDLEALSRLATDDFREHGEVAHGSGRHDLVRRFAAIFEAFPDFRITFEDVLVDGDRIAARSVREGTQRGPLGDIPPSGRRVRVIGVDMGRVRNGALAEHWGPCDSTTMLGRLLRSGA